MSRPLKPCPFCGSDARLEALFEQPDGERHEPYYGDCTLCETAGPMADTEADAVRLWNRRASPWRPWNELDPEEHTEVLAGWTWGPEDTEPEVYHIYFEDGEWKDLVSEDPVLPAAGWMPTPPLEADDG